MKMRIISKNGSSMKVLLCLFFLFFSVACKRESIDPVYVKGSNENNCLKLANDASQAKYGQPASSKYSTSPDTTSVWLASHEFKFSRTDSLALHSLYDANPYGENPGGYVEGIWAGAGYSLQQLSANYPEIFSPVPEDFRALYIRLRCSTEVGSNKFFNQIYGEYNAEEIDAGLGLRNYVYRNSISSIPVDTDYKNPDGTQVLLNCDIPAKRCSGAFSIATHVTVSYSYPMSQRKNWKRIHSFLVGFLNKSKE